MADNTLTTSGDLIATDDIAGVKVQRVKVQYGADGSATDVATANPLPVKGAKLSTAAVSAVASAASATTLKASNGSRESLKIFNDSSATLYIKDGASASTTDYSVRLDPGGYYEYPLPIYTGIVTGIWSSANGFARITEGT